MARFRGRISTATATWTTQRPKDPCPNCLKPTGRHNYRMDALSGRTVVICEHCHAPIPPRRRRA